MTSNSKAIAGACATQTVLVAPFCLLAMQSSLLAYFTSTPIRLCCCALCRLVRCVRGASVQKAVQIRATC